jgi:3',5'-cyclic AMP phosphodiesterase CpdA
MPRIAVTADLHFDRRGYLTTPQMVDDLVLRLQVKQVDAVILAGDLGHPSGDFAACLTAFRRLSVPVAVLAGNHDVWRDEQGWSSQELWECRLPSLVKEVGFIWLEDSVVRVGDVAVVGSLAWYDYSAAPASVPFPPEYFAAMKKNLNNDSVWIDWPWSDVEFASMLRAGLVRRLEELEVDASVREVVVITHVPLFEEQIVRRPGDRSWEISNAYFGNLITGQAVLRFKKVVRVISGHTHVARQGVVGRASGSDVAVSVIASDYGSPELEVVELRSD